MYTTYPAHELRAAFTLYICPVLHGLHRRSEAQELEPAFVGDGGRLPRVPPPLTGVVLKGHVEERPRYAVLLQGRPVDQIGLPELN